MNIEDFKDFRQASDDYDLIIVGTGAAGITLAREMSGKGMKILLLESGGLQQDAEHEALNAVITTDTPADDRLQAARSDFHGKQVPYWQAQVQQFGLRCRVLGGSTAGWAGKVAPFDEIDFAQRDWIAHSSWPVDAAQISDFVDRAAAHLDLGPLVQGEAFWPRAGMNMPEPVRALDGLTSFFWQFARSRHDVTGFMRFGPDFRAEHHTGVSVCYNATVVDLVSDGQTVSGVKVRHTLDGSDPVTIDAGRIVLAAGAIENARLLLIARDAQGRVLGDGHNAVGRYLTDHPSVTLGHFDDAQKDEVAALLGYFAVMHDHRVFMYAHGLALDPDLQKQRSWPNMAVFVDIEMSKDDPWLAFRRLTKRESSDIRADLVLAVKHSGLIFTTVGRQLLNYNKIPLRLRRLVADTAVRLSANFVARDYQANGAGRKLEHVSLRVICEQPPEAGSRVTLSEQIDAVGLPVPRVDWQIDNRLRQDITEFASYLKAEFDRAGISGLTLAPDILHSGGRDLLIHDMAHTAGTTRMGRDPATSVVNPDCQVHGVAGLYVAGASVFPTSGHANPTLMIMALAIRLADHMKQQIADTRLSALSQQTPALLQGQKTVLVTGATGNLGRATVDALATAGYAIRGTFNKTLPNDTRVDWVSVDFADDILSQQILDDLVTGVDAVIHFAGGHADVAKMDLVNITNLKRLAETSSAKGVRYFGQSSSMVVYGSPVTAQVSETSPVLDLEQPLHQQYFAEPYMRQYARTKLEGERALKGLGGKMHVDIYRIAVAQSETFMKDTLDWSMPRRMFALYRNSHFISSQDTAQAIVHLMKCGLARTAPGYEVFNIADAGAPTFAQYYRDQGRRTSVHIPLALDVLKGVKIGRKVTRRRPMGAFRLDNGKLLATGFVPTSSTVSGNDRNDKVTVTTDA